MTDLERLSGALAEVEDPEIPISLVDLGVLQDVELVDDRTVDIRLVPTRLGCPGIDEMERRIRATVQECCPDWEVQLHWDMVSWTPEMMTAHGRQTLEQFGYTLSSLNVEEMRCPYCGSADNRVAASFGASLCKLPFTCRSCGSTFDALRSALQTVQTGPRP